MDIETPKNIELKIDLYALLSSTVKNKLATQGFNVKPSKKKEKKKKGPQKTKFQIELEDILKNFK